MRVLVADDSKAMRMIVIRTLRHTGLAVDEIQEAGDGAEALAAVDDFGPDLILSNWNMPTMNGLELLATLRASGVTTSFGFITAESSPAMRDQAIAAGADFLLAKPCQPDRLAELIAAAVAR